jgi:hypothetical protein
MLSVSVMFWQLEREWSWKRASLQPGIIKAIEVRFSRLVMLSYAFSFGTAPLCDRVLSTLIHTETNT